MGFGLNIRLLDRVWITLIGEVGIGSGGCCDEVVSVSFVGSWEDRSGAVGGALGELVWCDCSVIGVGRRLWFETAVGGGEIWVGGGVGICMISCSGMS